MLAAISEAGKEAGSEDGAKLAARLAAKLAAKLSTHVALRSSFDRLQLVLGVDRSQHRLVARAQLEPGARLVTVFSSIVTQVPHHAGRRGGRDEEAEQNKDSHASVEQTHMSSCS